MITKLNILDPLKLQADDMDNNETELDEEEVEDEDELDEEESDGNELKEGFGNEDENLE